VEIWQGIDNAPRAVARWAHAADDPAYRRRRAGAGGILVSIGAMRADETGLTITRQLLGPLPVTVYRPADAERSPAVVMAHGFAGA